MQVQVETAWFIPQIINDSNRTLGDADATTEAYSAFLNYQIQTQFNDQLGFVGISMPLALGLNLDRLIVDSSFNLSFQDNHLKNSRLLTSVRYDIPEAMQTLSFGDVTPRGQRLFNGTGILGGLSWRKNFQLNRYAHISPELELRTTVTTPTHARVIVNGAVIKEVDLLPGQIVLNQLPVSSSQGQAQLVLSDNSGHERTIVEPFYLMYNQLKEGLHDYEYALGLVRQHLGERDFDYRHLTLQGLHRYGLTNSTTLGFAGIKQEGFTLLNPQLQTTLGQYQQLEVDAAFSQAGKQLGAAVEAHYRLSIDRFQFQASGNWMQKTYTGFDRSGSTLQNRLNATVRYGNPTLGVFNLSYNQNNHWGDSPNDRGLQLSYGRRLFDGVYLSASVQQPLSQGDTSAFLSLEYRPTLTKENPNPLFDNLRYAARYLPQENQTVVQNELNLSRSRYFYNYNAQIIEQGEKIMGNLRGQYKTDQHIYTASLLRGEDNLQTGQLTVSGGIAALKEGIYFGRPITDSFAVIHIENTDKPTLLRANNMTIMETDNDTVLLPEFSAYSSYQIGIQAKRLDNLKNIRYNLEDAMQPLVITKRSGGFLDLKISRIFAVEGNIYLKAREKEYLALLPLKLTVDDKIQDNFTGEKGYFYLENLKPGKQILKVMREEGNCQVTLDIPETSKNLLKLGELECIIYSE